MLVVGKRMDIVVEVWWYFFRIGTQALGGNPWSNLCRLYLEMSVIRHYYLTEGIAYNFISCTLVGENLDLVMAKIVCHYPF